MIYRNFKDKKLSALGLGCMRFPVCDGDYGKIDRDAVRKLFAYAIEKGINYFDTAWGYHNGDSEAAVGELLKEYPRDSFYIATKFPGFDLNNINKVEEIFENQLKKCQVDYFDFYLFHNVCESSIDAYLNPDYRIAKYLIEQKKNGRIKHLGFSTHGSIDTIKRFLEAYGDDIEFCQIQLNWLDWKLQDAKSTFELLKEYKLPVWVMEPVRGGRIAALEPEYEAALKAARPEASVPEWAFRFLQTLPEVVVTLSGMSNEEQLKENISIYEKEKALNEDEIKVLFDVADAIISKSDLPCTGCRYCTTHCPAGLDIPMIIDKYNEHMHSGGGALVPSAISELPDDKKPSACVGCGSCEAVCPQNIKISEVMSYFKCVKTK